MEFDFSQAVPVGGAIITFPDVAYLGIPTMPSKVEESLVTQGSRGNAVIEITGSLGGQQPFGPQPINFPGS